MPVVAAAAGVTRDIRLGIGVTDLVRRHPASLAQTALTLDHVTGGRFVLGVGTGEALNLTPYGMTNERPLARLDEGLEVMRLLMGGTGPVDFAGDHFRLEGAEMGLGPVGDRPPPIWVAAHRPRGLALTGRRADGWLPLTTDPAEYARMLAAVRAAARAAGRDDDAVTPGLYARVVVAPDARGGRGRHRRIAAHALHRAHALRRGVRRPRARSTRSERASSASRPSCRRATGARRPCAWPRRCPSEVVRDTVIHGTPDDVAAALAAFVAEGARHIQLTNMTPLAAPGHGGDERGAARRRGLGDPRGRRVRARLAGPAIGLAAAALLAAGTPSALGASRTITIDGWADRTLAFSGSRLLWTEAATVRVDPRRIAGSPRGAAAFDYYRAEVFGAFLDRGSRRFRTGAPEVVGVGAHEHRGDGSGHPGPRRRRRLRDGAAHGRGWRRRSSTAATPTASRPSSRATGAPTRR